MIRGYALEAKIPFWTLIQAGNQWADGRQAFDAVAPGLPNEAQFNWNINSALALGAQGIVYFPLVQPYYYIYAVSQEFDFERNGLFGAWGNKNRWYYYAQNIKDHIGAIDEILMNSVNKGMIVSGTTATKETKRLTCILEDGSFNQLKSVEGEALVGCFNYNGKTALYVVNYSDECAQNVTLHFNGSQNLDVIQKAETSYVNAKNLTLKMTAGEGVLIVVE